MSEVNYRPLPLSNEDIVSALENKYKDIPVTYGEQSDPSYNDYEYFYYYEAFIDKPNMNSPTELVETIYIAHVSKVQDTALEIDISNTLRSIKKTLEWHGVTFERVRVAETDDYVNMAIHTITRKVRGRCDG